MFGSDHESEGAAPEDDEDGDEVKSRKRPRKEANLDDEEEEEAGGEDLFGDGSDAELEKRELDDAELESPAPKSPSLEPERFVEVNLPRHPGPKAGSDGHLYLMKIPDHLAFEPVLFDPHRFTMPKLPEESSVSAYTAATTSIRVRRDPKDPEKLQSNARIIRWSDGSLSLQVASSPNLYDLPGKSLAPDPNKPHSYEPTQDAHTYLLDPHEAAGTLRVIGQATKSLSVVSASASMVSDQSIQRLQGEIATALSARAGGRRNPLEMTTMKDPEAERKEAEKIAKEKERAARKLENQKRRARERDPLGMEAAGRRKYNQVTGTRSKRDSPPITTGRGRIREDEYDLEDEFIEGSDEEPELEDESEEEEEEEEERRPRREREDRERKRRRVVDDDEEDDNE
ncbi:Leo1-like protein-domain-containing protein [Geopyxis carbonaria]|nr:Leo1-like protein-domain-containing protein [Geopyxis carbonaria]